MLDPAPASSAAMASFSSHAQALCCHRAAMAGKGCAGTTARAVHGFLPESEEDAEDEEARVRSARRLLPLGMRQRRSCRPRILPWSECWRSKRDGGGGQPE